VVDTEQKLSAFLPRLRAAEWVALDTEADSLHAYPEKVCLIQIGTVAGEELLDPLAGLDLTPLFQALAPHELIMHGADYDLRLLRKHHHFTPRAVFDTMLAARLLGHRQFGLTHLVARYLGIALEKGPQKANWARRPLTERMEHYALNDARHLKPLADRLRTELEGKGRLEWHREWCMQFLTENSQPLRPDRDSEWRIKGSHALARPALAVLRELWKWREREAIRANRPPFFILSHETLVALAEQAASSRQLQPLIPLRFSDRRREALLRAVEHGLAVPAAAQPEIPQPVQRRPTEAEMRRFRELARRRDARAAQLHLDPTVIASRSTLSQLARDWHAHAPELLNWQRELLL
jgi:ribonuclease D